MTNYKKRISLLTFMLTLLLLLSTFWTSTINVAYAEGETVYSNVLDDLKRDERFSVEDFPTVVGDYSLQLVQVAESTDNELFLYVYQPASPYKELTATSVRMTAQRKSFDRETLHYVTVTDTKDRNLKLVSREGTLCKYLVEGYTVLSNNTVRSYEIIQFLRPFDSDIDTQLDNGNTITEVSCPVSEKVTFTKVGDITKVDKVEIETIQITDKYVGFVRYSHTGDNFFKFTDCDSHFVAFSTEKKIEKLCSATVSYKTQNYIDYVTFFDTVYDDVSESIYKTVQADNIQTVSSHSGLFFTEKTEYSWKRIQKPSEFFVEDNMEIYSSGLFSIYTSVSYTDECREAVEKCDWVLRFVETDYSLIPNSNPNMVSYFSGTIVSDVSILTLTFEEDGVVYTLGVIDNKQTGPKEPSGTVGTKIKINFPDIDLTWLYVVLGVVVLLILVSIIIRITNFFRRNDTTYRRTRLKGRKRK